MPYKPPHSTARLDLKSLKDMPMHHLKELHDMTKNQLTVAQRLTRDARAATVLNHRLLTIQWVMDNYYTLPSYGLQRSTNS